MLLAAVQTRQHRRDELTALIATSERFDVRRFDRNTIEPRVREYVSRWRALLTKRVEDGRRLLREVLAGPLRFTPEGRSYRFEGEVSFGRSCQGSPRLQPLIRPQRDSNPRFSLERATS